MIKSIALAAALAAATLPACGGGGMIDGDDSSDAALGATDAAPIADAAIVQCTGDHQESLESTNDRVINEDNQVEPTGLLLSGQNDFSICGEINGQQANGDFADVDVFEFALTGEQDVRIQFLAETGTSLQGLEISLFNSEGPSHVATGTIQGRNALLSARLQTGVYWLAVFAPAPGPNSPIGYEIRASKAAIECDVVVGAADFVEGSDGALHRGNDIVQVVYGQADAFSLTADSTDKPENSLLTVAAGSSKTITGVSASIVAADDYRDRDTILIHTGAETSELSIRLSWDHEASVDLDLHIFAAGVLKPELAFGAAATTGMAADELASFAVLPNTDYWLWVGLYDETSASAGSQDYRLTVCGAAI